MQKCVCAHLQTYNRAFTPPTTACIAPPLTAGMPKETYNMPKETYHPLPHPRSTAVNYIIITNHIIITNIIITNQIIITPYRILAAQQLT